MLSRLHLESVRGSALRSNAGARRSPGKTPAFGNILTTTRIAIGNAVPALAHGDRCRSSPQGVPSCQARAGRCPCNGGLEQPGHSRAVHLCRASAAMPTSNRSTPSETADNAPRRQSVPKKPSPAACPSLSGSSRGCEPDKWRII